MGLEIGDGNWAWVLGHAAVWALVGARVLGLCLTAPALADFLTGAKARLKSAAT